MRQSIGALLLALLVAGTASPPAGAQTSSDLYEEAKLLASDGRALEYFGSAVAISGKRLVVGAWEPVWIDGISSERVGVGYVFERRRPGWVEVARLQMPTSDKARYDILGTNSWVSVSGARVVIGAPWDNDLGEGAGAAYVFEPDESGRWVQVAKLLASDGDAFDDFGAAVALSETRLVVGAKYDDELGRAAGSSYVFERDGSGAWFEVAKLLAAEGHELDHFGRSVAISGERLVVGTERDGDEGNTGAAIRFRARRFRRLA